MSTTLPNTQPAPRRWRLQDIARRIAPLGVTGLCIWWISQSAGLPTWDELTRAFSEIGLFNWIIAYGFTALSLSAVAGYDAVWHRVLRTGISRQLARRSGFMAVAPGQALGASAFIGAFIRWQVVGPMTVRTTGMLTACVALSFIMMWGILTALASAIFAHNAYVLVAGLGAIAVMAGAWALWRMDVIPARLTDKLSDLAVPQNSDWAWLMICAAVDTLAAAAALWVLLPDSVTIGLWHLYPIYMAALGAALLSNTPSGLGPFDLAILAAFATANAPEIMISLIAFRVVYYATPAMIAAVLFGIIRGFAPANSFYAERPNNDALHAAHAAARSESLLMRHPESEAVYTAANHRPKWLVRRLTSALVALFDPLSGPARPIDFEALRKAALQTGHHAVIYKCNAQTAQRARNNGWQVLHMSDDAVVDTRTPFNTAGSNFRQLRRKLKSATQENVVITKLGSALPAAQVEALNAAWVAQNAREYGFSMGTFCTEWMAEQIVFLAHQNDKLVGFISFHAGDIDPENGKSRHWTLDLLRAHPNAPTGTAHAMITQALRDAHDSGVYAVSLASAPPPKAEQTWLHRVLRPLKNQGLRQFKSCFGPAWKPLYLCAPSRRALGIGGAEVLRAIRSAS